MPTHLALLRGINVGGRNRVAMAELRAVFEALGCTDVATYIQSGNVVFSGGEQDRVALTQRLQRAIVDHLGIPSSVVVLTRAEVAATVANNPFGDEADPRRVHVVFHRDEPDEQLIADVAAARRGARESGGGDEAVVVGRCLYLHTPDGFGRSQLAERLTRRRADAGTARNWATVTRLLAMLEA